MPAQPVKFLTRDEAPQRHRTSEIRPRILLGQPIEHLPSMHSPVLFDRRV